MSGPSSFGWGTILRLGLVQTALGAIVVLITSTLNRVMVVELALPAALPGGLVALHYAVQMLRPRWGYGSDLGRRRTPWIVGGMALLALGGAGAASAPRSSPAIRRRPTRSSSCPSSGSASGSGRPAPRSSCCSPPVSHPTAGAPPRRSSGS